MTREEAKEILTHNWTRVDNPNYSESELDEAFFMAIEALSADAVQVVRCKDCAYCEPYAVDTGEDCMTGLWCGENQRDTTSQDYCSCGERKGGDSE